MIRHCLRATPLAALAVLCSSLLAAPSAFACDPVPTGVDKLQKQEAQLRQQLFRQWSLPALCGGVAVEDSAAHWPAAPGMALAVMGTRTGILDNRREGLRTIGSGGEEIDGFQRGDVEPVAEPAELTTFALVPAGVG